MIAHCPTAQLNCKKVNEVFDDLISSRSVLERDLRLDREKDQKKHSLPNWARHKRVGFLD